MTAVYEKHGIRFQYPENWKLEEHQADETALEIYVVAPTGAFWSLLAFDKKTDSDTLMNEVIETLDGQYDSVESTPVNELIGATETRGFDNYFYCLDLLVSNRLRLVEGENHRLMMMYQAENREFDKMELVFKAISVDMLDGLVEQDGA